MSGNRAARAAVMSAWTAARLASVAAMSGRRRNNADGRPGATAGAAIPVRLSALDLKSFGRAAQQNRQRIPGFQLLLLQRRQCCGNRRHVGALLRQVRVGGIARIHPALHHAQDILGGFQIGPRQGQPFAQRQKLKIAVGDGGGGGQCHRRTIAAPAWRKADAESAAARFLPQKSSS